MKINGKNYLILERRGCEYFENDANRDDIGNYRVGCYYHPIKARNGRSYIIEFSSWNARRTRTTNKRTGAELKHPITEIVLQNALYIDTQYDEVDENGRKMSYRDLEIERAFYQSEPMPYCQKSILDFVNSISVEHYDGIKFIQEFEIERPIGQNWTPAGLMIDLVKGCNRASYSHYYDQIRIQLDYDKKAQYKYLAFDIMPHGNTEIIRVYLERIA